MCISIASSAYICKNKYVSHRIDRYIDTRITNQWLWYYCKIHLDVSINEEILVQGDVKVCWIQVIKENSKQ